MSDASTTSTTQAVTPEGSTMLATGRGADRPDKRSRAQWVIVRP
jgi:hypothetical protein